jgi:hypothetical protein
MVQGGYAWAGFQLSALPDANSTSKGYAFWVENIYASQAPNYIYPPSGFNGVAGKTITLTTQEYALCSTSPIKWEWEEIWQLSSAKMSQDIGCIPNQIYYWGYYILESPALTQCANGYDGLCQLPDFGSVSFTGNICYNSSNCIYINLSSNPGLLGYYIVHNTQDTTTGGISTNGNQWTETWDSPGT